MTWLFDWAELSVLEGHLIAASIKGIAALCLALRRASAAARHFVWSLALTGLLALPLLSFGLPVWQIALLPSAPIEPVAIATDAPEVAQNAAKMTFSRTTPEPIFTGNEPATTNVEPIAFRQRGATESRVGAGYAADESRCSSFSRSRPGCRC